MLWVAREVRALQLLVAERPHGHPCLSPWMKEPTLFVAASSPWICQMFGPPARAASLPGTRNPRRPQKWDCQGLAQVSQEAGWRAPWETRNGKMPSLSSTVWIPRVIFVWDAQIEGYLMGGWDTEKGSGSLGTNIHPQPPFSTLPRAGIPGGNFSVLCLHWRTVAGYQSSLSQEVLNQ